MHTKQAAVVRGAAGLGELDFFVARVIRVMVVEVVIGEVRVVFQMFVVQCAAGARVCVDAVNVIFTVLC